uniref:H-X9-DG-CTERM domain-containing protein n=1 Tax=Salmonella enterica TaxID=28901 RepID=UPI003298CE1E
GLPRHSGGANMAFADGHVKYIQALDARSAADTRAKLQGRVPWQRNGDPTQARNSPWDAQF